MVSGAICQVCYGQAAVGAKTPGKRCTVGCRNIGKEHYGYSDTHNVLHVVHNHKWRHLDSVGSVLRVRPGFSVSHAKQMVSHSARNFQRGHLFVPRVVQSVLSGLQCRSLRGPADHRIRRSIQQEHPCIRRKNGIKIWADIERRVIPIKDIGNSLQHSGYFLFTWNFRYD